LTTREIAFEGQSIGHIPARDFHRSPFRKDIQIVFQDPNDSLNPRFTAFDCIAHPLLRLGGMRPGDALRHRVEECAQRVGLEIELLTRFPHQLSGGQKARIGIARAIACRPLLLVLDEPTAALDVSVQAVVLQLLDRLRHEEDLAFPFVSHDLNVVRRCAIAPSCCKMAASSSRAKAAPCSITRKPLTRASWSMPCRISRPGWLQPQTDVPPLRRRLQCLSI
jgi:ABC-type microcin C transport system duplicated ATPase subunit YejF